MTSEPITAPEAFVERGLELLQQEPWIDRPRELTLLLTRPPRVAWYESDDAQPGYWLVLDLEAARGLDASLRDPLVRDGFSRLNGDGFDLDVFTAESASLLLEATTRRALEARWTVRHATAIEDPLGRHAQLASLASRLPSDALERLVRGQLLQLVAAIDALPRATGGALIPAGEAAAAATRLACLLEDGAHPPAEWLLEACRETSLGRRLRPWLDRLAGDEEARAGALRSTGAVLGEVQAALRPLFGDRDWVMHPQQAALRLPRERR